MLCAIAESCVRRKKNMQILLCIIIFGGYVLRKRVIGVLQSDVDGDNVGNDSFIFNVSLERN